MGSLFLRTRKSHGRTERRWVATMRMPDGTRPSRACHHEHTQADRRPCDEATASLEDLLRVRAGMAPLDLHTLTVGQYLQRWVSSVTELRPNTLRQHEMIVRVHLEPAFRQRRLVDLAPSEVDHYLSRRDLHPQTRRHHRATLRRALADAVRDGYIARNPAALSRPPRLRRVERRYLTAAEARRLIDSSRAERLWPLWTLLVTTGLRLSEALGLAWTDIEWGGNDAPAFMASSHRLGVDGRQDRDGVHALSAGRVGSTLTVRRQLIRVHGEWKTAEPKTQRSRRTILLIPQAVEALAVQRDLQDAERGDEPTPIEGLIFTTVTGLPLHGTNILPPFRRALAAAGLPRITLHDLRHSCATMLLGAGVPLPVIAEILGHSSIRVTADLYAHIVPELRQDAADRLAGALGR